MLIAAVVVGGGHRTSTPMAANVEPMSNIAALGLRLSVTWTE